MSDLTFLFWNVGQQNVSVELKEILKHKPVDILSLAEFKTNPNHLIQELQKENLHYYHVPQIGCKRIAIFSKLSPGYFEPRTETRYYTMKELCIPHRERLLIVFVHLSSKLYMSESDQMDESRIFKAEIERAEHDCNNDNTIIVGDFNMNPFERGMVAASGIHSIPCSLTAIKKKQRTVKDRQYTLFYNPMWNLFGDKDQKPGTYYHDQAKHVEYFWHILDQVVIRPKLIETFDVDSLEIITEIGNISLVDEDYQPSVSDHLPICFAFTF